MPQEGFEQRGHNLTFVSKESLQLRMDYRGNSRNREASYELITVSQ